MSDKMNKAAIKAAYLRRMVEAYPEIYQPGSRPLAMANKAADAALAGNLRLEGDCWRAALIECGVPVRGKGAVSMSVIAALPEGPGQ